MIYLQSSSPSLLVFTYLIKISAIEEQKFKTFLIESTYICLTSSVDIVIIMTKSDLHLCQYKREENKRKIEGCSLLSIL
jgi:hypothetical protein